MALQNTSEHWGALSKGMHWLVVLLVLAQFALARIAGNLPLGMEKLATLTRHKSIGITILGLAVLRLLWRTLSAGPALPSALPTLQRRLAAATHVALYAVLFAIPLSGWLMSSAKNYPVSWFGLLQLPDLVAPDEAAFRFWQQSHEWLTSALLALAALHVLAALKHHFVDRDDVLRRMLPFVRGVACWALLAGGAGLAAQTPVQAAPAVTPAAPRAAALQRYRMDPAASRIEFQFTQAGAVATGRFVRATGEIDWPASGAPRGARLSVDIDMASLDTRDSERDALLRGADLFDTKRFPRARFVSSSFVADAAGKLRIHGTLQLRDRSRAVELIVTELRVAPPGGNAVLLLQGNAMLKRLAFDVGRGEWASTEWVADAVTVSFSARFAPVAAP